MIGHPGPGRISFGGGVIAFDLPAEHVWMEGTKPTHCRSCSEPMLFVTRLATGKNVPLNPDGTSHFTTCPQAASWSRREPARAVTHPPLASGSSAPMSRLSRPAGRR